MIQTGMLCRFKSIPYHAVPSNIIQYVGYCNGFYVFIDYTHSVSNIIGIRAENLCFIEEIIS